MLILVSGYADSGKTTFSHYLASTIDGAICFDSLSYMNKVTVMKIPIEILQTIKKIIDI